jgi:hypothetical protein
LHRIEPKRNKKRSQIRRTQEHSHVLRLSPGALVLVRPIAAARLLGLLRRL